jgi:uncharacterized membrane protein
VLWIVIGIIGVWMPFSEFYTPGYVEEVISGFHEGDLITPEFMLVIAIIMLIPLVMAALSLTLKDKANRWANIIMGAVTGVLSFIDPILYVTRQSAYSGYVILIGIVMFVFAALIVWYAWKSKQKA